MWREESLFCLVFLEVNAGRGKLQVGGMHVRLLMPEADNRGGRTFPEAMMAPTTSLDYNPIADHRTTTKPAT